MVRAVAGAVARRHSAAEALVVDQVGHRRVIAAYHAVRIAAQLQNAHVHGHRVELDHAADERLARAENQLDRFECLHAANQARQHAEHARLGAARRRSGRRWLGEQAAIAGPLLRVEHARLAFELEDRAIHQRLVHEHARIVDEIACREVVAAVDDDVEALEDPPHVLGGQALLELHDLDVGIERLERQLGGIDFGHTDAVVGVQDLALQVREIDDVVVDETDRADSGGCQIESRRRAEPARADQQHLGVEQLRLPGFAHLGK